MGREQNTENLSLQNRRGVAALGRVGLRHAGGPRACSWGISARKKRFEAVAHLAPRSTVPCIRNRRVPPYRVRITGLFLKVAPRIYCHQQSTHLRAMELSSTYVAAPEARWGKIRAAVHVLSTLQTVRKGAHDLTREVHILQHNVGRVSNIIKTSKFTLLTFIPVSPPVGYVRACALIPCFRPTEYGWRVFQVSVVMLLDPRTRFANFYFLCVGAMQVALLSLGYISMGCPDPLPLTPLQP
eukprot:6178785-Pleurochrysis_carterae.AAC.1